MIYYFIYYHQRRGNDVLGLISEDQAYRNLENSEFYDLMFKVDLNSESSYLFELPNEIKPNYEKIRFENECDIKVIKIDWISQKEKHRTLFNKAISEKNKILANRYLDELEEFEKNYNENFKPNYNYKENKNYFFLKSNGKIFINSNFIECF